MRYIRFLSVLTLSALLFTSCYAVPSSEDLLTHASDVTTAIVWVAEDATDDDVAELEESLRALDNIQAVTFISKDETLSEFAATVPEETFESLQGENNPMLDAFKVEFVDTAVVEQTVAAINQLPFADDVSYASDIADVQAAIPAPIR